MQISHGLAGSVPSWRLSALSLTILAGVLFAGGAEAATKAVPPPPKTVCRWDPTGVWKVHIQPGGFWNTKAITSMNFNIRYASTERGVNGAASIVGTARDNDSGVTVKLWGGAGGDTITIWVLPKTDALLDPTGLNFQGKVAPDGTVSGRYISNGSPSSQTGPWTKEGPLPCIKVSAADAAAANSSEATGAVPPAPSRPRGAVVDTPFTK